MCVCVTPTRATCMTYWLRRNGSHVFLLILACWLGLGDFVEWHRRLAVPNKSMGGGEGGVQEIEKRASRLK